MNHVNEKILISDYKQKTLKTDIQFNGVGVHSGRAVSMNIEPAKDNTGIIFKRIDLKKHNNIKACYKNIGESHLCTKIINESGVSVSTIEHLMAAFSSFGIDNAIVNVNSSELPALDGSSHEYTKKFLKYGIKEQTETKKQIKVLRNIKVSDGNRYISIFPSEDLSINISIDYPNTIIGKSKFYYVHSKENFIKYLSEARTYALFEDIEKMRTSGNAMGGSLNNAIVVDKFNILNSGGLRFEKEFVKHKTLDCIGDFYLLGMHLTGNINCFAPGHKLNQKMVVEILKDKENYKITEMSQCEPMNNFINTLANQETIHKFTNVA